MPLYESVFISRQDISAAQAEALSESFGEIVTNAGGTVAKNEYWGLRNLAYRIKKSRKGHYSLMNLDAPPAAIQEMERNMRLHEDVIRFMTIRVDEHEEGPSAILKSREDRGTRHGRGPRHDDRPRRDSGPREEVAATPVAATVDAAPAETPADTPADTNDGEPAAKDGEES
jgi:small subunit ribosomal protein S6